MLRTEEAFREATAGVNATSVSQDGQLHVAVLRFKLYPRAELSEAFLSFPHTGAHFSNVLVDYLYLVMF